jgi:hypothetical protein
MMTGRRNFCGSLLRFLAAVAMVFVVSAPAGSAEPDQRLAANPALARIARADPAEAQRLLGDIDQVLRRPAPPPLRGGFSLGAEDEAFLSENPLLEEVYAHNAEAALELLKRVKEAAAKGGK